MAIHGVKRERYIFVDPIPLGSVLICPPYHGTLDTVAFHNSYAALVTSRITTVAVQCTGGRSFIKTAVRIGRLHGIAIFGADTEYPGFLLTDHERLIVAPGAVGGGDCGGGINGTCVAGILTVVLKNGRI